MGLNKVKIVVRRHPTPRPRDDFGTRVASRLYIPPSVDGAPGLLSAVEVFYQQLLMAERFILPRAGRARPTTEHDSATTNPAWTVAALVSSPASHACRASRRPGHRALLSSDPCHLASRNRQRALWLLPVQFRRAWQAVVGVGQRPCDAQTDHRRLPLLADGWLLPAAAAGLHATGAGRPVRLTAGAEPEPCWLWLCQLRPSGSPWTASS